MVVRAVDEAMVRNDDNDTSRSERLVSTRDVKRTDPVTWVYCGTTVETDPVKWTEQMRSEVGVAATMVNSQPHTC